MITIHEDWHTKRHCKIWICKLTEKVSRPIFDTHHQRAKSLGGYYSRFGPMTKHGFIFFDEAKAREFAGIGPAPNFNHEEWAALKELAGI